MLLLRPFLAGIVFASVLISSFAQSSYWTKDTTFTPAVADYLGGPGGVSYLTRQSDGKYLVTGQFTKLGGVAVTTNSSIARLNTNGALDTSFKVTLGADDYAEKVFALASGKVLAFGQFASAGGAVSAVARFNADGSRDPSYVPVTAFNPDAADNQGAVYGRFDSAVTALKRLTVDGAIDPSFVAAPANYQAIAALSDGTLLIRTSTAVGFGAVRLRHDGSADTAFQAPTLPNTAFSLTPLPDGRALVIGSGGGPIRFARIKATGEIDYLHATTDSFEVDFQTAGVLLDLLREASGGTADLDRTNPAPYSMNVTSTGQYVTKQVYPDRYLRTSLTSPSAIPTPFIFSQPATSPTWVAGSVHVLGVTVIGLAPFTVQWTKNGALFGAPKTSLDTGFNLTFSGVQPEDAGTYAAVITNAYGSVTTVNVPIVVTGGAGLPVFTVQPQSLSVAAGGTATFSATVTSATTVSYQWTRDNVNLAGATASTLTISNVQATNAGAYRVRATNAVGATLSNAADLSLAGNGRISNLSVRTNLGDGKTLTVGFVTSSSKNLLIRAIGPSLGSVFNLGGFYPDPRISLRSSGTEVDTNDTWSSALSGTFASLGAFPLAAGSADAALSRFVDGPLTAEVSGRGAGIVLVEVYDAGVAGANAHLKNVSARNQVGLGADALVSGFVIDGGPKRVLIRGIGPALADVFGVGGVLTDPVLEIHQTVNGQDTIVASNNDWDSSLSTTFTAVGAYAFKAGSKDAALLVTLSPGAYTAQVSGANNGTGDGVVEVYEVP